MQLMQSIKQKIAESQATARYSARSGKRPLALNRYDRGARYDPNAPSSAFLFFAGAMVVMLMCAEGLLTLADAINS